MNGMLNNYDVKIVPSYIVLFFLIRIMLELNFKKFEIKQTKSYASGGIRTRKPWVFRPRNTCAKKTAENV